MSIEQATIFIEKVKADETLRQRVEALVHSKSSTLVEMANEEGFQVSLEDFQAILPYKAELSEEDLAQISGGTDPNDGQAALLASLIMRLTSSTDSVTGNMR